MITTLEEYNNYYVNIINSHPYKVNEGEPYIQINLNTRTIDMQNMMNLGVLGDHNAETLWFQVDRYFDTMDLLDTHIAIQCRNANPLPVDNNNLFVVNIGSAKAQIGTDAHNSGIFVPEDNKGILRFPWTLTKPITEFNGTVEFSIRFFKLDGDRIEYSLNTQPAQFNVCNSLNIENTNYASLSASEWQDFYKKVDDIYTAFFSSSIDTDENGNPVSISRSYESLTDLPRINGYVLRGNQNASDLGIALPDDYLASTDIGNAFDDTDNNKIVSKEALNTRFTSIEDEIGDLKKTTPFDSTPTKDSFKGITSGAVYTALQNVKIQVDDALSPDSESPVQNKVIYAELEKINESLGTMTYVPLTVSSFTIKDPYAERGTSVSVIDFDWTISKDPDTLTVAGQSITKSEGGEMPKFLTLNLSTPVTDTTTYTLEAVTTKETVTKETTLTFCESVIYGVATAPETYDNNFIISLIAAGGKKIQPTRECSFEVNSGTGQYIYFASPVSYGDCVFKVGGFEGGFELVTPSAGVNYTRNNNYASQYYIYKSTNPNLGSTTIEVN